MDTCCDLSFGLNSQALAVATLLAHREPDFADYDKKLSTYNVGIETRPWYNGREKGVAFVVTKERWRYNACLILVVVECRNSDSIIVEEWEEEHVPFNGPTIEGRTKSLGEKADQAVFESRKGFKEGQIGKVADYIYRRMEVWYDKQKKLLTAPDSKLKALPGGKNA
jgi:hypothetical protein